MLQSILREDPGNLSDTAFQERYFHRKIPVVLTKAAKHWKAVQLWSPDYFLKIFPNKLVKIFHFQRDENQWKRSLLEDVTISDAIALMKDNQNINEKYYILKDGIEKNYPELNLDFTFPRWVSNPAHAQNNLWFGEKGNTTPLHYDSVENFFVQVFGHKQLRLFSPEDSSNLYPHSVLTGGRLNFSQIHDIERDLSMDFPLFCSAQCYETILEPGDILYLPPGWWHEVRTLDLSISLSFWFDPKRNRGPLWHLLGYTACRLDEGLLTEKEAEALYSCKWANALDTAEFMRNQSQRWIAVLIAAFWLENRASVPSHFSSLLKYAQQEDNGSLPDHEIKALIEHAKTIQKLLYRAQESFVNLDSTKHSQLEVLRSDR